MLELSADDARPAGRTRADLKWQGAPACASWVPRFAAYAKAEGTVLEGLPGTVWERVRETV